MTTDWFALNRRRWEELAAVHPGTGFYRVAEFKAGEDVLLPIELAELGDVAGKSLLHLQCHFGLDTLNWARKGARVAGLDFSGEAIRQARRLAMETGLPAEFVEANVYDAATIIRRRFDIVYVSWGALIWLPDVARWAKVVAALLEPGGFLYVLDGHPTALMLEQTEPDGPIMATYPYFHTEKPLLFRSDKTYAADDLVVRNEEGAEWMHPISDVVSAILEAGLSIEFLHEHDALAWQLLASMGQGEDRMWRLPEGRPTVPLAFSVKARRHA